MRSSSLLEDSEGSAFSGKYRSLFLVNTGSKEDRLSALLDAIAEVYASIMGPDPIQYRKERGLLDFMEEMGILIQRVVGTRVGKYFFPAFAGVAFSNNEFRWSPRIRREDGIIRMVTGLGTRAVDRVGDDYPTMIAPGQPGLRVNATPQEALQYAQRHIDVLNIETGRFESPLISDVLAEAGNEFPILDKIFSVYRDGVLRKPSSMVIDPAEGRTGGDLLGPHREHAVHQADPDDHDHLAGIHGTSRGHRIRFRRQGPLSPPVPAPELGAGLPSRGHSQPHSPGPEALFRDAVRQQRAGHGNQIPRLCGRPGLREPSGQGRHERGGRHRQQAERHPPQARLHPHGPRALGKPGDITLGVPVTYSDINNTAMLVEVARRRGGYVPDLSFGTHFFQDLVEANIKYLALYPDEEGAIFNEGILARSPNALAGLLPDYAQFDEVVRVLDVEALYPGMEIQVIMDGEKNEALAFLREVRPQVASVPEKYGSAPKD